jgi:hypothetical protein
MFNSTSSRCMHSHVRITSKDKQTHKLMPQTCVLWVPGAPGYAANFGPGIFQVSSHPDTAYHLTENEAEDLAMALRTQLGIRSAIRPYYAQAQG